MAVIGIDLGTTNSACSVWRSGEVEMIPNRLGALLTPSVVGVDDKGNVVTGQVAKERLLTHSQSTVSLFKRLMGTEHEIKLGARRFTATELSSLLLQSLKEDAEAYLGEPVTEAVISVPAYFNHNQRHATKAAGELAGLVVKRLVNEPTAAAMAYGLHEQKEGTFIILDMGGGTFDVSILEYFDGVMEVHASAGDNFLGGEDFVDAMLKGMLDELKVSEDKLSQQERQRLYGQLEAAKRRLGEKTEQSLELVLAGTTHQWLFTDEWFVRQVTPLLIKVRRPIAQAMSDANMENSDIDDVLLVGGATKLKHFRATVAKIFGRFPSCSLDPDLVVAMGAGIQSGLVAKDQALDDVVLTDVCPYTLGTSVIGPDRQDGYFLPIIERNSVVPVSIVRSVYTAHDNQTRLNVDVFQGENRKVSKNVFLGNLYCDVPSGPAGKERVDIRYSYDMNGLLEVDVEVVSTGKRYNTVIQNSPTQMSAEEVARSRAKLAKLKFHPRDQEENLQLMAKADRLYEYSLGNKREYIGQLIGQFDAVLNTQNQAEIARARVRIEEALKGLDDGDWY